MIMPIISMRDRIINLVNLLSSQPEFDSNKDIKFSLTINLERIIDDYKSPKFDPVLIIESIKKSEEIESFNLTLKEEYPDGGWTEEKHKNYWFTAHYIFYGKDEIDINFSFLSSQVSINQLGNNTEYLFEDEKDIKNLINIGNIYKNSSLDIYETLKKFNKYG